MKKILIFDDDIEIISILNYIMDENGWMLFSFTNCINLLEKVKKINPDLILMDHWIPESGGVNATRVLKEQEELKEIPVIYFSAINKIEEKAQEAGADAFIAKPFELIMLEDTIARFLEGQRD